jgi:GLPGLI family protein
MPGKVIYKSFLSVFVLFVFSKTIAQSPELITQGEIRFEKKLNLYSIKGYRSLASQKDASQFRTTYFTLIFKNGRTVYHPDKTNLTISRLGEQPAENNTVYIDLPSKNFVSEKQVFEKKFVIADSIPKIRWKLTEDRKTIAGFECRRANALIMDSVYVVAFYTDAIPTTGGPELFSGLPGMILGVSLPHAHISWFATRLIASQPTESDFLIPAKNAALTNEALKKYLLPDIQKWGEMSFFYLMEILL